MIEGYDRRGNNLNRAIRESAAKGGVRLSPRKVQIAQCTPSLGMVSIWWSRCVQCVLQPNNAGRSIFYLRDKVGGEIAEVRNALVEQVLNHATPHSHIFWIDDDVLVFPGCLLELFNQDADICAGVYFTKLPDNLATPLIYDAEGTGAAGFPPNAVLDVWGHGMGLTLVRTDVYRRMADELEIGKDKYGRPRWYRTFKMEEEVAEDEKGVVGVGYTEDLYFLKNANKLGYVPRVVTSKHAFGFHYDAENDQGYPTRQWKQWVSGEPITWEMTNGPPVVWD